MIATARARVWADYVQDAVEAMARSARHGFAFNGFTIHGDPPRAGGRISTTPIRPPC
jgi:hypothetical protein